MRIKLICACIKSIFQLMMGSRAWGRGGRLQPPVFAKFLENLPFLPQILAFLCLQPPSHSSQPPHFQIHSTVYAHLNRIHEVVVQIKISFFHNFTLLIAEILALKLYLCCQKVDFSEPMITITDGHITFWI